MVFVVCGLVSGVWCEGKRLPRPTALAKAIPRGFGAGFSTVIAPVGVKMRSTETSERNNLGTESITPASWTVETTSVSLSTARASRKALYRGVLGGKPYGPAHANCGGEHRVS